MKEQINGLTREEFIKLSREEQVKITIALLSEVEKQFNSLVADHIKTGEVEYEEGIDMRLSFKQTSDKMRKNIRC